MNIEHHYTASVKKWKNRTSYLLMCNMHAANIRSLFLFRHYCFLCSTFFRWRIAFIFTSVQVDDEATEP